MSLHRVTRDLSAPPSAPAAAAVRPPTGPVVLFIAAVLIAGLTCILYLWQQSQIVANQQDIRRLDAQYTVMLAQKGDLQAQVQSLESVTNVVAKATQYGMVQGDSSRFQHLDVQAISPNTLVAQNTTPRQSSVVLPATNAAITSWWQDAWDGLFSLLQ